MKVNVILKNGIEKHKNIGGITNNESKNNFKRIFRD